MRIIIAYQDGNEARDKFIVMKGIRSSNSGGDRSQWPISSLEDRSGPAATRTHLEAKGHIHILQEYHEKFPCTMRITNQRMET
jgi:hypothetical protein